jgi:hypothetical protein
VCESDEGCEVCGHFCVELGELNCGWRNEIVVALQAGVEEDCIDCGVLLNRTANMISKEVVQEDMCIYFSAKAGMLSRSAMSADRLEAFEEPWVETNKSRRSFRRPTAVTWIPSAISFSAIAFPMPDVAPTRRICLYGNDIFELIDCRIFQRCVYYDTDVYKIPY